MKRIKWRLLKSRKDTPHGGALGRPFTIEMTGETMNGMIERIHQDRGLYYVWEIQCLNDGIWEKIIKVSSFYDDMPNEDIVVNPPMKDGGRYKLTRIKS
jgi:hypothetical protein